MSSQNAEARAVFYRFDRSSDHPLSHLSEFDQEVMFTFGVERNEGEHMAYLNGPHKPYDSTATDFLHERLGIESGTWSKFLSINGEVDDLERFLYSVEDAVFKQHVKSEDLNITLRVAEEFFAHISKHKELRRHSVPTIWVLNEDDTRLLHLIHPKDLTLSGGPPWRELVTKVVKAKLEQEL